MKSIARSTLATFRTLQLMQLLFPQDRVTHSRVGQMLTETWSHFRHRWLLLMKTVITSMQHGYPHPIPSSRLRCFISTQTMIPLYLKVLLIRNISKPLRFRILTELPIRASQVRPLSSLRKFPQTLILIHYILL